MLKKLSAALLAVSMLAAPAFAASPGKPASAPATKIAQVNTDSKSDKATASKREAKKVGHTFKHRRHHRARHHKAHASKSGALEAKSKVSHRNAKSKVSFKHTATVTRRG